jgi:AcrB/AcrD/AcrF family
MIFIDAIEIDERLASHLVGPNPFLCDQLIGFRFSELSIATPVLKLSEPAAFVVVVVSHGS